VQALPPCIALNTKFVPPASSVMTIGCVVLFDSISTKVTIIILIYKANIKILKIVHKNRKKEFVSI
jgi:hypothetical protein